MAVKTIVILANSYKHGNRCIAGKEVVQTEERRWRLTEDWFRPVTLDPATHGAIPLNICWDWATRRFFRVLDIIEIDFIAHVPEPGQPENWTFDIARLWAKAGYFGPATAISLLDDPADIWHDTAASNINMVSEAYTNAGNVECSLQLIQPEDFRLHLSNDHNPWEGRYKTQIKASFSYKNTNYSDIGVTDPVIRDQYARSYPNQGDPANIITLPAGDNYSLCISLAPPFASNNNTQSKLLAAVIPQT